VKIEAILDKDSGGWFGWLGENDCGVVGDEFITKRFEKKKGAVDRLRWGSKALGMDIDEIEARK